MVLILMLLAMRKMMALRVVVAMRPEWWTHNIRRHVLATSPPLFSAPLAEGLEPREVEARVPSSPKPSTYGDPFGLLTTTPLPAVLHCCSLTIVAR